MKTNLPKQLACLYLGISLAWPATAAPTASRNPTLTSPPVTQAAAAPPGVRLDFRDASLAEVIRLLAETYNANIVATEKSAKVRITVFLRDVSLLGALDAVAKSAGLWYRHDAGERLYRVMTAEEYQKDILVFTQEETRSLTLRNANVVAAANAIKALFGDRVKLSAPPAERAAFSVSGLGGSSSGGGTGGAGGADNTGAAQASGGGSGATTGGTGGSARNTQLTPGQIDALLGKLADGDSNRLADLVVEPPPILITYNLQHNFLLLRSSDRQALNEAERLVRDLDRPVRQLLLEMKVLEVTLGDGMRSAFDFSYSGSNVSIGTGNFPTEGGTLVFNFLNQHVSARLQALASENRVRVLSTPLLLTSNQQPAALFIGEERVLVTNITSNTVTNENQSVTTFTTETEKRNIGNTLSILPRINADRTVSLSIVQDASRVLPDAASLPVGSNGQIQEFPIDTVNTSNLRVDVVAKDRLTIAVGGMIQERVSDAESKVPLLGDVPVLGTLFKRQEKSNSRTELVLLITPYILDNPEEGEQRSLERVGRNAGSILPQLQDDLAPGPAPGSENCTGRFDQPCPPAPPTAAAAGSAQMQAIATPPSADPVAAYAALTRHALLALSDAGRARHLNPAIQPAPLPGAGSGAALFRDAGLAVRPVAAWQQGGLHATVLAVDNPETVRRPLDSGRLNGRWLAATAERDMLEPAGRSGATAHLVLISEQAFDASVAAE